MSWSTNRGFWSFLQPARRSRRLGPAHKARKRGKRALGRVEHLEQRVLLAADIIQLGPQTGFFDQPYVEVELMVNNEPTSPGLGPYDAGYGIYPYNRLLLDTGANSALIVSDAAAELEAHQQYVVDGTYLEQGVAGYTEFDVSAPYRLDFRGTDGITHTLPQTASDVRILSSSEVDLGGPAQEGGIPGVIGMPAMTGRLTTLDMTPWIGVTDFLDLEPLNVRFPDSLPASNGYRYTVPLDTRVTFDAHDGLPEGSPPDAPVPVWANVPFMTGVVEFGGLSRSGGFLLDTGAQLTVISESLARSIGLDEDGDGTFDMEAHDFIEVGGVGGIVEAPLLWVESVRLPTVEGQDLVWRATAPEDFGIEVIVLDIAEGIDGVFGVDLLTCGLGFDFSTWELAGTPYFDQIHFDFRNWASGAGSMIVDVNAAYGTPVAEPAGIRMMPTDDSTTVVEGGAGDTYQFVLTAAPAADVEIGIIPSDQLEVDKNTLVFTAANWDTPQTVTVTGVDDAIREGPHTVRIQHFVMSGDAAYNGLALASLEVDIVDNHPIASVTASPDPATVGQPVSFDAGASYHGHPDRHIVSYEWDFGDGNTATTSTPLTTHTYASGGSFQVQLTVIDDNAPPRSDTAPLNLEVQQGNRAPVAVPGGPYSLDIGADLTLDGSGSYDPDAAAGDQIVAYAWDLDNDGQYDDAFGAQPVVTWTVLAGLNLAQPANPATGLPANTVGLQVTDSQGSTHAATTTLRIYDNRPVASFTATPNPAAPAQTITFDAAASYHGRPGRQIVSYHWDFGDGSTLTTATPTATHAYGLFDSFTVTLTVTDDNTPAKTDSAQTTINVSQGNRAPVAHAGGPYAVTAGLEVVLNGSGSSEPDAAFGDGIVSYAWELDGDGLFDDVVTSQASVSVPWSTLRQLPQPDTAHPIQLRVTDRFGLTHTASTTMTIAAYSLGAVDFKALAGLDPVNGDLWYRFQTTHAGTLTLEASAADPNSVGLALYNASYSQPALAVSSLAGGVQRIDYATGANVSYLLRVSGSAASADLRLLNLVQLVGTSLTVSGTEVQDSFVFDASAGFQITLNGVPYSFTAGQVNSITLDGGAGMDSATFTGSAGNESVIFYPYSGTIQGPGYAVTINSVETKTMYGGGGSRDSVRISGSNQDDTFTAGPTQGTLSNSKFFVQAVGFSTLQAFARVGTDKATFTDSSGADTFVGRSFYSNLFGTGFYVGGQDFDEVIVQGTPGSGNTAYLTDTAGDESVVASPGEAVMTGSTFKYTVSGCDTIFTIARNGGFDTAQLSDGPGIDTFDAYPDYATLYGSGFYLQAKYFDEVRAIATDGGTNTANFFDSPGNDLLEARLAETKIITPKGDNYAVNFLVANAYGYKGGTDTAHIYDSPGNDTFKFYGNTNPMYGRLTGKIAGGALYDRMVKAFDVIHTYSESGGNDAAYLYDSAGDDTFTGSPGESLFSGSGFSVRAVNFGNVYAYGNTGGNDTATLNDTAGSDHLEAGANWARLSANPGVLDLLYEVTAFDSVTAKSTSGSDTKNIDPAATFLILDGTWQ